MKAIQIKSADHNDRLARERSERMRPHVMALAEEAGKWVGAYGPGGESDRLRSIKSVTEFGTYKITVRFDYPRLKGGAS